MHRANSWAFSAPMCSSTVASRLARRAGSRGMTIGRGGRGRGYKLSAHGAGHTLFGSFAPGSLTHEPLLIVPLFTSVEPVRSVSTAFTSNWALVETVSRPVIVALVKTRANGGS